jgi:hypothetical protein
MFDSSFVPNESISSSFGLGMNAELRATKSVLQMIATYCLDHIIQFRTIQCMANIDVHQTYKSSVAVSMIVMALSIIAVVILWATIGHIGPTYSSDVMSQQRRRLRQHYGLPAEPLITNLKILQIPPSLRSVPLSIYYGSSDFH